MPVNLMSQVRSQRFFTAFLCFSLLAAPVVQARHSTRTAQENKESQLKAMQAHIAKVSKSIQADAEHRDSLVGELKSADENIQSAREQLADIHARRVAVERQLAALQTQSRDTERQIEDERNALAGEIRMAYMNGNGAELKLLLNQQDPAKLGRMLGYYGYFSQARAQRIETINDHLAHLAMLTDDIQQQNAKLRAVENEQSQTVAALSKARNKRVLTLHQVEAKLKTGNQKLAKLRADASSLERLIEELRRAAAAQEKENGQRRPVTGRGRWPWPVKGELLARYGEKRVGELKWQGLLIAAPEGTQVHATAAGRVLYSDWLPGLGLLLVIDHGNGIMSLYGRNEQLYKKQGEEVKAGDVVAAVGDSGAGGRSGLYLEIRDGKRPVNPLDWLGKP